MGVSEVTVRCITEPFTTSSPVNETPVVMSASLNGPTPSRVQCPLLRKFLDRVFHLTEFNTLATASLTASDNDCTSRLVAFRRPLASSFDRRVLISRIAS